MSSYLAHRRKSFRSTGPYIAQSVNFDEDNEHVDITGAAALLSGLSSASFGCWVKVDVLSTQYYFFSLSVPTTTTKVGFLTNGSNRVVVQCRPSASETLRTANSDIGTISEADTWYHVVAGIDIANDVTSIWFDGVKVVDAVATEWTEETFSNEEGSLSALGMTAASSNDLNGKMAQPFILNRIATTSEVQELYNGGTTIDLNSWSASGSVILGLQNQISGSTWTDEFGSIDGTLTNMEAEDISSDVP